MGFLLSLLSGLPGVFGQWFAYKAQQSQANAQVQMNASNNAMALGTASLGATSPSFKEKLILVLFVPFFLAIFWPSKASEIFAGMQNMPAWYMQECVLIFNTVFGITAVGSFTSSMFDNISAYAAQSQAAKIKIAQIDKAKFYEALKHLKGNVTTQDVASSDAVINEYNKGAS